MPACQKATGGGIISVCARVHALTQTHRHHRSTLHGAGATRLSVETPPPPHAHAGMCMGAACMRSRAHMGPPAPGIVVKGKPWKGSCIVSMRDSISACSPASCSTCSAWAWTAAAAAQMSGCAASKKPTSLPNHAQVANRTVNHNFVPVNPVEGKCLTDSPPQTTIHCTTKGGVATGSEFCNVGLEVALLRPGCKLYRITQTHV